MLAFTTRNAVVLALVQIGIIVIGALASGLSHKLWLYLELPLPRTTWILLNWGPVLLFVPIVWIAVALKAGVSSLVPDEFKAIAFFSGFVIAILLLLLVGHAVISPLLRVNFQNFNRPTDESFQLRRRGPALTSGREV